MSWFSLVHRIAVERRIACARGNERLTVDAPLSRIVFLFFIFACAWGNEMLTVNAPWWPLRNWAFARVMYEWAWQALSKVSVRVYLVYLVYSDAAKEHVSSSSSDMVRVRHSQKSVSECIECI